MENLHFSITINAPKENVWDAMLEDATYREWTSAFTEGLDVEESYYEGSWDKGSKIKFLSAGEKGMFAEIADNRPYEFVSIRHLGEVSDGVEMPWEDSELTGYENYTFAEKDGETKVSINLINIPDDYVEDFKVMWPKALEKLKQIAERR